MSNGDYYLDDVEGFNEPENFDDLEDLAMAIQFETKDDDETNEQLDETPDVINLDLGDFDYPSFDDELC